MTWLQRRPSDQAERDRILTALGETLFVEAGAGTGKTRSLVDRIVRLIAEGRARMEGLAAITFTEAAAAELRDRVLASLERASQDDSMPGEERARCAAAIAAIDEAAIETIHGFAARLLGLFPLEAGLPPGFEVVDETIAAVGFAERWRDHFEGMLEDPAFHTPLRRALAMGAKPEHLRTLAEAMHGGVDRLLAAPPLESPGLGPLPFADIAADLESVAARCDECYVDDDRLLGHLQYLGEKGARLRAVAGDEYRALRLVASLGKVAKNAGRKPNWPDKQSILDDLEAIDGQVAALLADAAVSAIVPVVESLRAFVLTGMGERKRRGQVEFQDLLLCARDLVRSADVRAALRRRYSHVLIDEFQDTDPLQAEIAFLLGSLHGGGEAGRPDGWLDVTPDPGFLFFVGDPKQSIYRFRRADIETYQAVQGRFAGSGVSLVQNFRSRPEVLAWVNAVFGSLFAGGGEGQARYVPLEAARPAADAPAVHVLGGPEEGDIGEVRRIEAGAIASTVGLAKRAGWPVEGEAGAPRPARFQDIAILLPARTALPPLLEALEDAGIPYRLESRSLVYETQEVRDLLAVLRAVDDPTDEVALVAALRSPAFACADDDLVGWRAAGGRWDYRREPPEDAPAPVAEAVAWLREAYERRWWEPVSALVESTIRDRRLMEQAFADRRPRERWQRLRFILDQARAFEDAGGRTLREFLAWAERQKEEQARVLDLVVPEADDDAVRIMTVHAAKGLEFPVVIMAGLNAEPRAVSGPLFWTRDGAMEVRLGSNRLRLETPGAEDARLREQALDDQERVRLLYVAATRARDRLVLSLYRKAEDTKSPAAQIALAATERPDLWQPLDPPPPAPGEAATAGDGAGDALDTPEDRARWLAEREAVAARGREPVTSATALAHVETAKEDEPGEEAPPWRRGRGGTALGRAVHSVLQTIDLASGGALEETARAQAAAEGIPHRAAEVARRARAALDSRAVREAVASGRYWREIYAGAPVGEMLVEGFIDLLYEGPEGYVIVDYKTDALDSDKDVDDAVRRYAPQLGAYALVLGRGLPRPVARAVLLFLRDGGAVEREVPDLPSAVEAARAAVAAP